MSYYDFPHTRNYDSDLGFIIERIKKLTLDVDNWKAISSIKFASPIEWDVQKSYEPYYIVLAPDGNSYLSIAYVPPGVDYTNNKYWERVANSNRQIENLQTEIENLQTEFENLQTEIENLQTEFENLQTEFKNKPFKMIDINNKGDFISLTEYYNYLIENNIKNMYAFIFPGRYETTLDLTVFDEVVIIGYNKETTELYNNSGVYKYPVLNIHNNTTIRDITIRAIGNPNFLPTYNFNDVVNTFPSYALHCDTYKKDTTCYIYNCNIISTSGPAIGAGTYKNSKLYIQNCYIYRNPINEHYKAPDDDHNGALLVHNANTADVNQILQLDNNEIISDFAPAATIRGEIPISTNYMAMFITNNRFIVANSTNNTINYKKGNSVLINSYGNNNNLVNSAPIKNNYIFWNYRVNTLSEQEIHVPDLKFVNFLEIAISNNEGYNIIYNTTINLDFVVNSIEFIPTIENDYFKVSFINKDFIKVLTKNSNYPIANLIIF